MLINIEKALKEIGYKKSFSVHYDDFKIKNFDNIYILEPFDFKIMIQNRSQNTLSIVSSFYISFKASCDRCLSDTVAEAKISIDEELKLVNHKVLFDDDSMPFIEGEYLDVDKLLHEWILLNISHKILCKSTCKGLCHICGQNLNIKDCGCDKNITSLQMEKFKEIFKRFKEV